MSQRFSLLRAPTEIELGWKSRSSRTRGYSLDSLSGGRTTQAVPAVTITLTLRRTNSAAISAKRSVRPSAHRYSICDGTTLDPTEFAQSPHKSIDPLVFGRRRALTQEPDHRQSRLLRPHSHGAAERSAHRIININVPAPWSVRRSSSTACVRHGGGPGQTRPARW
jgi:hypothetical protein